jgi:hypothetical protein
LKATGAAAKADTPQAPLAGHRSEARPEADQDAGDDECRITPSIVRIGGPANKR